jgi:hypothetical protein
MTTRTTPFAPGTPCWVDLTSSDLEASKDFYAGLLGWTYAVGGADLGGYVTALSDGHAVAGMVGRPPAEGAPNAWTTYISTEDIAATTVAASAAGAIVVVPPRRVGAIGVVGLVLDPAGALVGLWQPGVHLGFSKYNEPGSVTWDEHHSKNFAASTAFYATVFGWTMDKTSDTDQFRYFQGQIDGETVAGLMDSVGFLPPELPSHWAVYFSVGDADEAVQTAVGMGGSLLRPAEDTPFGRIADLADITGAPFKVHSNTLAHPHAPE